MQGQCGRSCPRGFPCSALQMEFLVAVHWLLTIPLKTGQVDRVHLSNFPQADFSFILFGPVKILKICYLIFILKKIKFSVFIVFF